MRLGGFTLALLAAAGVSACGGTHVQWRPSLVTHVPDSMPVRFQQAPGSLIVTGTSVSWDRAEPRVVTAAGDTVTVPRGSRLEVRLKEPRHHVTAGAVVGWAVATATMLSECGGERTCGEQDPRPLLGIALGALVGRLITTPAWVQVRW